MRSRAPRALMAWLAAAAMLFAAAGPIVSGHAAVDAECAPALSPAHDHTAHRLSAAPEAGPDHCGACHLTRTIRELSPSPRISASGATRTDAAEPASSGALRFDLRTDFTRGPPSA